MQILSYYIKVIFVKKIFLCIFFLFSFVLYLEGDILNEVVKPENDIENIVEKYADMIVRIGYLNLKNMEDAEDVAQEVFIKLIEHKPDFENENHEKANFKHGVKLHANPAHSGWLLKFSGNSRY